MLNNFSIEELIILLSECQLLRIVDRWLILFKSHPELIDKCDFQWIQSKRLSNKRYNLFIQYIEDSNISKILNPYHLHEVQYFTFFDAIYPVCLKHIYAPPLLLYYKGNPSLLCQTALAVVGPRNHSEYSQYCLKKILPEIISKDIVIISGLAKGVDTLAHKMAIELNGQTIGVIGCGLDVVYPSENINLQTYMCKHHLVISEYPLFTKPDKSHFPMRNRIIAGLCRGVMVTEARERSGTLITARMALEEGRDIFAIPGPIHHCLSNGTNQLIKAGAIPFTEANQLFEEWLIK